MRNELVTITYKLADGTQICVEVSTEVKDLLAQTDRQIRSQRRQDRQYLNFMIRTDEHYDNPLLPVNEDTADLLEIMERDRKLYESLNTLTATQCLRLYLYFFEGLTYTQIAKLEGVKHSSVIESIKNAIKNLKKFYQV